MVIGINHSCMHATVIYLDGCVMFRVISWPAKGTVNSYLNNCRSYMIERSKTCDDSIKSLTRSYRDNGASRVFLLQSQTTLPLRDVVLKLTDNKPQRIKMIVDDFIKHPERDKLILTEETQFQKKSTEVLFSLA